MTIDFYEISANTEVPSTLTEVGSSGPQGTAAQRVLIIGARNSAGTVAADTAYRAPGETSGDAGSGVGSPAGEMVHAYREIDQDAIVDVVGLDDSSATAATGSLGLSGTATAAGEIVFRIGGRRYAKSVAVGDSATSLLTAIKALIDADTRRQATTGTIASGAIPLTSRCKGAEANAIDLRREGAAVAGITVALTAFADGASNPSISAAIAAVASQAYDVVIVGLSDTTNVAALETEMARRAQGGIEMPGMAFFGVAGSLATVLSYGGARNSKHTSIQRRGGSATNPWTFAAMVGAAYARSRAADPGRPFWGIELPYAHVPEIADRDEFSERNQLAQAGVSIWDVNADGKVFIERLVTAYKTDSSGQPDKKFQDCTTMSILADWRRVWRAATGEWRKYKLVDDGTPLAPGVRAITPIFGKAFQDGLYAQYAATGNVQQVEEFAAKSRCERDTLGNPGGNRKRLNFYQPVRIGDFVVVLAARIEVQ